MAALEARNELFKMSTSACARVPASMSTAALIENMTRTGAHFARGALAYKMDIYEKSVAGKTASTTGHRKSFVTERKTRKLSMPVVEGFECLCSASVA
jgi:hypothetical protein